MNTTAAGGAVGLPDKVQVLGIPYGYCHCGCGQKTNLAQKTRSKYGWVKGQPVPFLKGHYQKLIAQQPIELRFWSKVATKTSIEECWEWQASCSEGYGQFAVHGILTKAHRVAYELTYGDILNDLWVLHKCDNRLCCNPSHLFLGTPQVNTQDMINKGRNSTGEKHSKTQRGEGNGRHKLSTDQVISIRSRYKQGGVSQHELAREMQVSFTTVHKIVNGKSWRSVKDD